MKTKEYTILVIDDKEQEVQEIIDTNFNTEDYVTKVIYESDFNKAIKLLAHNCYEIIILDLKKDPGHEKPGEDIFRAIWEGVNPFIPVIIFTAHCDTEQFPEHPLIFIYDKTQEIDVLNKIKELLPQLSKISEMKRKMNYYFREGFRVINTLENIDIQLQRMSNYIKYAIEMGSQQENLPADIQYIFLPRYDGLITCDIIEDISTNMQSERKLYMILTPWCEIEHGNGFLECKVIKDKEELNSDKRRKLINSSNKGGDEHYIILPDTNIFRGKYVDVSETLLIKKEDVSLCPNETDSETYHYRKLLSIASPYRERMINLCYNNRSRIGVPNLNRDSWWKNGD